MKKVGIITFFHDNNVGTCLQAAALQKTIEILGYEVEIIDYKHQDIVANDTSIKKRIKGMLQTYFNKNIFSYKKLKKSDSLINEKFDHFRKNAYLLSESEYKDFESLKEIAGAYDAFVCGSDMIWTPNLEIDYRIFFLGFCEKNKRIAYAPSFGTDTIPEHLRKEFTQHISEFHQLSCRESSGVDIIEKLCGIKAELVLDPTQLICKEDWIEQFQLKKVQSHDKYVLCYLFDADKNCKKWYRQLAKQVAQHYHAKVRYIPMSRAQQVNELKYGDAAYGPIEFMDLVYHAEFVITNSYHGFMFSLIFEKPFVVVRRNSSIFWSQFEKRFESVLEELDESQRLLGLGSAVDETIYQIDYEKINKVLNKRRKESVNYLKKALETTVE